MKYLKVTLFISCGLASVTLSSEDIHRDGARELVGTVASDKAVLQGIAPIVAFKIPSWTSTGDPCLEYWEGVTCDFSGYVTGINIGNKQLGGNVVGIPYL
jgi:hypothetical protein